MLITLTPELERLINEEIESGDFESPHEVLWHSLMMFKESKLPKSVRRENLRREIQKGIDARQEGKFKTYDSADEMIEDVIKEAHAKFEARKKNGA